MSPAEAAAEEREVRLTTLGRKSGKPRMVTIWISTDGRRLFVRSGQGLKRDWPKNLLAHNDATLRLGGEKIKVRARHLTDPAEAREVAQYGRRKYGPFVKVSKPGEPPTLGEQATFELVPTE